MSHKAPPEISALAVARAVARETRDWPEADRLRAEIEAAGWSVVDRGIHYTLRPAHAPDLEADGTIRYGRSGAVPSRLEESASAPLTVVLVADDRPEDVASALRVLCPEAPAGTQVVIAANDPTPAQASALAGPDGPTEAIEGTAVEIVWTSARLGRPAALNAALRRAVGSIVVVLAASPEMPPGALARLLVTLDDPTVAIAGLRGAATADLRRFTAVPDGDATIVSGALAFRRADLIARGPLDERYLTSRGLDASWSLTLRDEGDGAPPRRALVVERMSLDAERTSDDPVASERPDEGSRAVRRDYYRLLDRFDGRVDLLETIRVASAVDEPGAGPEG